MESASQAKLGEFIRSREMKIPDYQRGYEWEEEQVSDFINDIEFVKENDINHYFGTIVTHDDQHLYNLIDGQQRLTTTIIFFSRIANVLERLEDSVEENSEEEREYITELTRVKDMLWESKKARKYRLTMDPAKKEIFEAVVSGEAIDESDITTPSGRRIVTARDLIEERIIAKKKEFEQIGGSDWRTEFRNWVLGMSKTTRQNLTITEYQVDSENEAGRMFGVLNDRGKDLNIADRVKSYLVYIASSVLEDEDLVRDIYEKFTRIFERIGGKQSGVDGKINEFMKAHWALFSGDESETDQVHRRIKTSEKHIPISRSNGEIEEWINKYLQSVDESSESYQKVMEPLKHLDKEDQELRKKLHFIRTYDGCTYLAIGMALFNSYDNNDNVLEVVTRLEKLVVRDIGILMDSYNIFKQQSRNISHRIEWMGSRDEFVELFGSKRSIHTSETDSVKKCKEYIDEYLTPASELRDYLTAEDILTGEGTVGWTGVRKGRQLFPYLLFEYENHLRNQDGQEQIVYNDFAEEKGYKSVTLEHISPRSMIADEERINSLGNLTLLESDLNSEASDKPYRKKTKTYNKSDYLLTQKLSDSTQSTWGDKEIVDRTDIIAEFILEKWG